MSFPQPPFQSSFVEAIGKVQSVWAQWLSRVQSVLNGITGSGVTAGRPIKDLFVGQPYFDTSLNYPVFWNGSDWVANAGPQGPTGPIGPQGQQGNTGPSGLLSAYYGSFYDTHVSQVAGTITSSYPIFVNSTAEADGITIQNDPSGNPTLITFEHSGVYNVQYSIQFTNTDSQIHNVNVWLRKNDTGSTGDVPYSNSQYAIVSSHGGINGQAIAAINYVLSLAAGDYLQLMWQPESTQVYIETIPAGTTPTTPVSPGVILTACQVRQT